MLNAGIHEQKLILWDMWQTACKSYWMARRPASWHFDRVLIEDRYPGETVPLEIPIDEDGPEASFASSPPQWTPVISWRTEYPGRSYRGRTFWGPFLLADVDETTPSTELENANDAFAFQMLSQFGVGVRSETEPHFVIVSRRHDNMPEPVGRFASVTDWRAPHYFGIQRRRLQYWNL